MPVNAPSRIEGLNVWWHEGERCAAENLAFDEALLTRSEQRPTLRFYQWSRHHGVCVDDGLFPTFRRNAFRR